MSPNSEPEDNSSVRSDASDPAALLRLSDTFDKLVHSDDNGDKEQNQEDKTNEPKQPDLDSSKSAKDDVKATQEEKGMNNDDTIVETPPLPPPPPTTQAHGQNGQNNKQNTKDNGEKKQDEVQLASSSLSFHDVAMDDASTPLLTPELLAVATPEQDEAEMTTKKSDEDDNDHSSKEAATSGEQEDVEEGTLIGEGDDHRNGKSIVSSPDGSDRSNNSSSSSRVESLLQITKTPSLPSKKSTHEDDEEEDITKSSEEDDGDQKTSHSSARVMSYDDYEDESAFEDILGPLSPPKTKKSQTTTTPTLTENKEEEEKKHFDDGNKAQNSDMIAVVPSTPPKTKNDPIPPTVVSATQLHQNFETFMVDQGRKRLSIQNKVIHHNEQVADLQQRIRDLQAQLQQHNQELHRLRHEADTLDREELHRLQQRTLELKATPTPVTITNTSKQMTETGVDGLAVVSLVTDKEHPQGEGDNKTGADSGDIDNGRTTSSGGSAGEMVTESAWNTLERFMQCSPQHESP